MVIHAVKKSSEQISQGTFELNCLHCHAPIVFSLFELEEHDNILSCTECGKKYLFGDELLKRQLNKFAKLCRAIQESEEILGSSAIALSVGNEEVKIPFKILLTRLKSTLDLDIGSEKIVVSFRIEPTAL
jgi:DNA-directed RNA polymerase subunit RPC12/RpoP